MNSFLTISLAVVLLFAALAAYAYFLGRVGQRKTGLPSFALPREPAATALDRAIDPLETAHPAETGLRLIVDNHEAFSVRYESARSSGRSLDLQYYFWKADLTGKLLCLEVIRAAERGVRVRLLIDDINSAGFDATYLALDSHPNIDVRLFNPCRSRASSFRRGLELILKYFTATRRMHNKCWIADGRLAIIGGRNIGDEYFDASPNANFKDVDLAAVGRAVSAAQSIFDTYWNSDAALPVRSLHKIRRPKFAKLKANLLAHEQTQLARSYTSLCEPFIRGLGSFKELSGLHWVNNADVVADPPQKASAKQRENWLSHRIEDLLQSATSDIRIVSPYFIPGHTGAQSLSRKVSLGLNVAVLTNSLAATDVIAVHGAYAKYRYGLVAAGLKLYELQAKDRRRRASLFGSRTASLHTKALVVDGRWGFVGSFNLDPRSASINTEMGIVFDHAGLAAQLHKLFDYQIALDRSFQIKIRDGRLIWEHQEERELKQLLSEPAAPRLRILIAKLIGLLPIESQL